MKSKHYERGYRHGKLGVYRPGIEVVGKRLLAYKKGHNAGRRDRFNSQLIEMRRDLVK